MIRIKKRILYMIGVNKFKGFKFLILVDACAGVGRVSWFFWWLILHGCIPSKLPSCTDLLT